MHSLGWGLFMSGVTNTQKNNNMLFMQSKPLSCSNLMHFLYTKKSRSVSQNTLEVKAFSSLSLSLNFSLWCQGVKSVNMSTFTGARSGWVTSNEISDSSLSASVSSHITSFPTFICKQDCMTTFCSSAWYCERQCRKLTFFPCERQCRKLTFSPVSHDDC